MWADLQEAHEAKLDFVLVDRDTDEGGAFALSYGLKGQPAFVILAGGEIAYAAHGPWDEPGLRALVRDHLPN